VRVGAVGVTGDDRAQEGYRSGRYNWGGVVKRTFHAADAVQQQVGHVVSTGLDDTMISNEGLGIVAQGFAEGEVTQPIGGVAEAMNADIMRERAEYHQTVAYRAERRRTKRQMTRASRIYGKKYYLTRGQVILGSMIFTGSVLVLGSVLHASL